MKLSTLDLQFTGQAQEALAQVYEELPETVEIEELCHGLKAWTNPINGFRVLRLHYSADPRRRTQEWREAERRKYGVAEWNREQELIWESLDGKAVYGDFWSPEFHISKVPLGWNPKYPVCRGWDFGLNGACIFAQLFPHSRLLILREAVSEDIAFERFVEEVARLSSEWFPGARFIEFIDPTGRYRAGSDGRSYAGILASRPLGARHIINGANDMPARIKGVTDFLRETVKGIPSYLVDSSCETLIRGFNGGYFYPFDAHHRLKEKPEKNFFSHIHDANQYLCSKVKYVSLNRSPSASPKEPRYGKGLERGRSDTYSHSAA